MIYMPRKFHHTSHLDISHSGDEIVDPMTQIVYFQRAKQISAYHRQVVAPQLRKLETLISCLKSNILTFV